MQAEETLTISSDAPGKSLFMLGNEAIARGAIEAGLQVYAAYPGTPSSEISETLINLSAELNFHGEWSVNEQVAFEVAFGASMCGVRAMTSMKHVGLNVAHDPLMSATYMGTIGGMVLVDADDPGLWSSQNEQDNRYIAEQAYLPVLEPSSPQEAKDMIVDAFNLSEEYGQIFMLRSVTRLSHARGDVRLGPVKKDRKTGEFKKSDRLFCMPAWARKNRVLMLERFARIKDKVDTLPCNQLKLIDGARLGVIASGIAYTYAVEALKWLGLEDKVSLLKIGTPHPLPEKLVRQILVSVPQILVIEELEPFVENHVRIIAQKAGIKIDIRGKDVVPVRNELSTRKALEAIAQVLQVDTPLDFQQKDLEFQQIDAILPSRPPTLCAGCPHRGSFYSINAAVRKVKNDLGERVLAGDIGCYSLGVYPPLNSYDTSTCMGAGFGIANGLATGQKGPVVGHLGDSTFFHSGIPPMINAVFNKNKITMVVLDNSATSMTGFQPHPGAPANGEAAILPENIARACNVEFVEVVNAFDIKKSVETMEKAIRFNGPAVVVFRGLCGILAQRERRKNGQKTIPYHIDLETCTDCKLCLNSLGCPAIIMENDRVAIDQSQCDGCGVCAQVCPTGSIKQEGSK
ncbi:MAG: indolepyruvate ferredoxin oxidoreductase subunit alpha [Dehalococcoidales bacterium]|nr:indolepyruvate ferredoxin oxidoreductase subunit alpha [Dehalococcoidales bacterium]